MSDVTPLPGGSMDGDHPSPQTALSYLISARQDSTSPLLHIANEDGKEMPADTDVMEPLGNNRIFVTPEPDDMFRSPASRWQHLNRSEIPFESDIDVIKPEAEDLRLYSGSSGLGSDKLEARGLGPFSPIGNYDEEDGDDDCMVVDENSCSLKARRIWQETEKKRPRIIVIPEDEPAIKREQDTTPEASVLNEVQRSILLQFHAQREAASASSVAQSINILSPKMRPGRQGHLKPRTYDAVDIKFDLDSHMSNVTEDDSWMYDDFEESDEQDNIMLLKGILEERRNRNGALSQVDDIELMRLERRIAVINRRQQASHFAQSLNTFEKPIILTDNADESSTPNSEDELSEQHLSPMAFGTRAPSLLQIGEQQNLTKEGGKRGGTRRKPAKNAREVEERRRENEKEKEHRKRARLTTPRASLNKKHLSSNVQQKGRKSSRNNGKSRMQTDGSDKALQVLLHNLTRNDILADGQAQEDLDEGPEINETSKEKQMKALLASVPADYDTHRTKTEKSDLMRASKNFGHGMVKACKGKWKLKGMKSPLYHHQLLATDWMVSRELGPDKPNGGVLADVMGLGKTLETLATMVANPPSSEDIKKRRKSTLIVIPSSAIKQWMEEIITHIEEGVFPRVMHYKASKEIPTVSIQDCDIVLTSYTEVMRSFPVPSQEDIDNWHEEGGIEQWREKYDELAGDLHKISWYRIVLDEAHAIKNYKSRTSLACQNLRGQFRWALSGTPIQNYLYELFPYFRFLRAPWTSSCEEFVEHFCDPNSKDDNRRMAVILSIVMRRTMKDRLLGKPIVTLPTSYPETKYIPLSKQETILYRILEDKFRNIINTHLNEGTAKKNYHHFLVFLLRLRQCTAHPFLLEGTLRQILSPLDVAILKKDMQRLNRYREPFYEQLQQWLQLTEDDRRAAEERSEPTFGPGEKAPFGTSEFGKHFRMDRFLDALKTKDLVPCQICFDLSHSAYIIDCNHTFCKECINNHISAEEKREGKSAFWTCPAANCNKMFYNIQPYKNLNLHNDDRNIPNDIGDTDHLGEQRIRRSNCKKSKDSKELDPYFGPSTWLKLCKYDRDRYLLPSAKTTALKAQILKWLHEAPNDKIIIFTQFNMMAKIIGLICEKESWGYLYFTGNMTTDQRHIAVKAFHSNPFKRIMIANLKCGGQSLNLTCANRIISIDLWWNHSVEQQAVGRVYRIGQRKETFVTRIVTKNTIDCRMLNLQAEKLKAIDRAMQDVTEDCYTEPLSVKDLMSLFGCLKTEGGITQVVRDYEDEDETENGGEGNTVDEEMTT